MTCSEILVAYKAPTRKVFMRGDLVCNKDMVVIVTDPASIGVKDFRGTVLHVDEKRCNMPHGLHTSFDSKDFELFTEKLVLTVK